MREIARVCDASLIGRRRFGLICLALVATLAPARACSLCGPAADQTTLREDAQSAKLVLYGTLHDPRLDGPATDLHIEQVIKSHAVLAGRTVVTLPRYVPVDPQNPPQFLVFCDITRGQPDPFRGSSVRSPAVGDYLKGALAIDPSDRAKLLAYYVRFLDHADPDIASDAYREFAKTGDADLTRAARSLDPARLRALLTDPRTPPERLSLFAYLLGACGTAADADLLARLLRQPEERWQRALGGLLAGYTQLRPDDGWRLMLTILGDAQRPFPQRYAALGAVRFFYRSQPTALRGHVLRALAVLLPQGDIVDAVTEDLRHWQEWGLTEQVLAQYGRPGHDAPLVRRAIVRYALCCPRPEARRFVDRLRQQDAALVRDVEESLQLERGGPGY